MEIKPVGSRKPPEYPRKEEISAEALKALPPQRWAKNAAATIALGTLVVVSMTACTAYNGPETATEGTTGCELATPAVTYEQTAGVPEPPQTPVLTFMPAGDIAPPTLNIAPLFVHGDGMGAFGCVMIAPPAFLSEDEALSVINEVAKGYGLTFTTGGNPEFSNVLQPVTNMYDSDATPPPDTYMTFTPDFSDASNGVCIEYVTTNDVSDWNHGEQTISAESFNTADAAAQLSEALENAVSEENQAVGVLYDPCARVKPEEGDMSSQASEQSRALAEEQLKAQAKDFFEWLKSQGVI